MLSYQSTLGWTPFLTTSNWCTARFSWHYSLNTPTSQPKLLCNAIETSFGNATPDKAQYCTPWTLMDENSWRIQLDLSLSYFSLPTDKRWHQQSLLNADIALYCWESTKTSTFLFSVDIKLMFAVIWKLSEPLLAVFQRTKFLFPLKSSISVLNIEIEDICDSCNIECLPFLISM